MMSIEVKADGQSLEVTVTSPRYEQMVQVNDVVEKIFQEKIRQFFFVTYH